MKGVNFSLSKDKNNVLCTIDPLLIAGTFDIDAFNDFFSSQNYLMFSLSADAVIGLSERISVAQADGQQQVITLPIASKAQANIDITIAEDKMSATMKVKGDTHTPLPDIDGLIKLAKDKGIKRGISKKRLSQLIKEIKKTDSPKEFSIEFARGLPPKKGKNSHIKPLVPNAIERVLQPQSVDGKKVDMRNLGDILCVERKQAVAEHLPPSVGRIGYNVENETLDAESGDWSKISLGNNTEFLDEQERVIIASVAGQPKFEDGRMSVDDTYSTKGVNVGTGNINYEGAVIVNGDVTENMQIIAKGDITINGFVESALIRAGGDIIITQGATGKMNDEDCQLYANGSIYLSHGQGLDVVAGNDINIVRQLAYSRIKCKGQLIVGNKDMPMGNLFASKINAFNIVKAGTVGAVSGSTIEIDFTEGYSILLQRLDHLNDLFKTLSSNNADHEMKIATLNSKHIPKNLRDVMKSLNNEVESERILLSWLRNASQELEKKLKTYESNARVIANKELFPGVSIKMNSRVWKAKKEYKRSIIEFEDNNWQYEPF